MRFVSALFPRNLCLSISNGAYLAIVLTPTGICLLLTFISIFYEVWDVTVYDAAALPFIKQSSTSVPLNPVNSSLLNNVLSAESSVFEVLDDNTVVFDSRGSCEGTISGLNGSFLTEERGGVWRLYRVFVDAETQALAEELCNTTMHTLNYPNKQEEIDFYCCGGCCAFEPEWRFEADRDGETTHDALYTLMSSIIVAVILQSVSVLMILVAFCNKSVTLCRMTGATILVSGLFIMFALMTNHYKISIMNNGFRSIPYLSMDILSIRKTSVGWCMYVAWAAVLVSTVASALLIQFSRFMVKLALESPDALYHLSNEKTTALLSRPLTAADRVRNGQIAATSNRVPSSTSLQPKSNEENGHVNNAFVAVQEL